MSTRAIRAALYVRVSTHEQDAEGQELYLSQLSASRGWEVVEVYRDVGVSGRLASRPALDRMMEDAARGRFDVIAVFQVSRISRSTRHLIETVDRLGKLQVGLVSASEGFDTSKANPMQRAMLQMIGVLAELESNIISDRVRAGMAVYQQKNGQMPGRPRKEVDLDAVRLLQAQGWGQRRIASALGISRSTLQARLEEA